MTNEEKIFHNTITDLEKEIENCRQKEYYWRAFQRSEQVIGIIKLAYQLKIIPYEEFELLFDKFYNYSKYYFELTMF